MTDKDAINKDATPPGKGYATLASAVVVAYVLPVALFAGVLPLSGDSATAAWGLTAVSALLLFGIALYALRREGMALEDLGYTVRGLVTAVGLAAAAWGIFAAVFALFIVGPEGVQAHHWGQPRRVLLQWLLVGIAEETLFRGYILTKGRALLGRLSGVWQTAAALLLTNLVFALWHVPQRLAAQALDVQALVPSLVQLFFVGLLLSYFYLRSRNILLTGLIHGGLNAPLVGVAGDLTPVLVMVGLVELWRFFARRGGSANGPQGL